MATRFLHGMKFFDQSRQVSQEDFQTHRHNTHKIMRHLRPLLRRPLNLRPKINRGHLIVMTNQYKKQEDFVINSFQDN
jgi:hypothetical protein